MRAKAMVESHARLGYICLLVCLVQVLILTKTRAAEFTWFSNVDGREGWIEFSAQAVSFQNRIHVLPRVGGPISPDEPPVAQDYPDGVIVKLAIYSDGPDDAASFTKDVLQSVVSDPDAVSMRYQVDAPRPRNVRLEIEQDGNIVPVTLDNVRLSSTTVITKRIPCTGDVKSKYLRGEFSIKAYFDLPTAMFSSASVDISEDLLTHYKVDALKSVVKSAATSGGKFLFFDWRRKIASTMINQSIRDDRSVSATRETSVFTVDPDDAMLNRIDQVLGSAPMSQEDFVKNHNIAAKKAEEAGDFKLAELHREYASKANDPTPRVQAELLEKAFEAASGSSEAAIGQFLASGIQFSETSSASSSRFQGFGETHTELFTKKGYHEMKLSTSMVGYVVSANPSSSEEVSHWFGAKTPNRIAATQGLRRAVQDGNVAMTLAALRFSPEINASDDYGKTPLIIAAERCQPTIAKLLLDAGANQYLTDGSQQTAFDRANTNMCQSVAQLLEGRLPINIVLNLNGTNEVELIKASWEESGVRYEGNPQSVQIQTGRGRKLFRAIITARIKLHRQLIESTHSLIGQDVTNGEGKPVDSFMGYNFTNGGSSAEKSMTSDNQPEDSLYGRGSDSRLTPSGSTNGMPNYFKVISSGQDSKGSYTIYEGRDVLRFYVNVEHDAELIYTVHYDQEERRFTYKGEQKPGALTYFQDLEEFGIVRRELPDNGSINPGSVCTKMRTKGMISECVRWEPR